MSLRNFIRQTRLLIQHGLYVTRRMTKPGHERRLELTRLEERVLFSASVMAPVMAQVAEVGGSFMADAAPDDTTAFHVPDQQLLDLVADSVLPSQTANQNSSGAMDERTLELVFLDASISNLDQMISDLRESSANDTSRTLEFVVLDSTKDGIAQITATLLRYNGVDGIHIVSHGAAGEVQLGSTMLSLDNLDRYRPAISAWQYSLSDKADILIYGCNLATSEDGQTFLSELSELTQTDVAASNDLTGSADLGGDWDLEFQTGVIDVQVAFSADLQAHWYSILATTSFQQGDANGYTGTVDTELDSSSPSTSKGGNVTITVDLDNGSGQSQGLIRFDNLFGNGPGQIPVGSNIISASLVVNVTDPSSSGAQITLHRMLANWSSTSTWNSMTGGISANGVEAVVAADSTVGSPSGTGTQTFTGLAAALQAWSGGATNYGWAILTNNTDGWDISTSEAATLANRPRLFVTYNAPPVIALPGGAVSFTENAAATIIDATATATDSDSADFDTGTLTVDFTANGTANDRLAIRNQGTGAGQIGVSGANVTYGGVVIGTFSGGTEASSPLIVRFNTNSSPVAAQALMRNITYQNISDSPSVAARTMRFVLTDGDGGTSNTATKTINVTAVNDAPVAAGWYNGSWLYRKQITIDYTKVSGAGDLIDFPVLINLSSDANLAALAQASGNDIVFTSSDGVTKLNHEIETFTSATGALMAWVRVPVVSGAANTVLNMYYGNAGAANQQNAAGVWASNYAGVWHLNGSATDSSSNANNGTISGATGTAGKFGQALNFNGSTDSVSVLNSASLQLTTAMTLEGWVNARTFGSGSDADVIIRKGDGNPNNYQLALIDGRGYMTLDGGDGGQGPQGTTALSANTWYYIVGTWNGMNSQVYVNGVLEATFADLNPGVDTRNFYIGGRPGGTDVTDGFVDEVRASNVARSAGWIATSYNNQNAPGTFYAVGAQQTNSITLPGTNEDTTSSATSVNTLLTSVGASDLDGGASRGIAVTATTGNGTWQYSTDGATWTAFGAVSATNALLLTSTSQVRYVPDGNNGETSTLTWRAWDQTSGVASINGTANYANPGAGGGTTAYSSQTASASMTITSVNDAPTLGNGTLAAVLEDTASLGGQTVSTIFAGQFADVDSSSSFSGIAVVGNTANAGTQGTWQYSSNGGTNWFAIGTVAEGATALAVGSSSLIRFVPIADYAGAPPALVVRGLDNTYVAGFSTTAGSQVRVNVNTTTTGGTTAIAAATANLSTTITAVNDAPIRTAGASAAINVNEDSANVTAITLGMSALTYGPGGGSDESGQTLTYTVTVIPAHMTLWKADGVTQVTASTVVTLAELQGLKYKTVADANGTGNLTWTVVDNGGTANGGVNTLTETLAITVNAVNDAPVRTTGTPAAINVNEDSANTTAVTLGMSALTYGPGGGSNESGQTLTYTVTVIPAHMTLWKADGVTQVTASTVVTLAELQGLKYKTVADANGSSNLTWTVVDNGGTANGGVNTLTETLAITVNAVNDAPVRTAGTPAAINVNEDSANATAVTLGMGALTYGPGGGSDESGQTLTYTVTVIPAHMTLWKADGITQVTASTVVTLTELQGLKYKTVANANGSGNLTWTVVDNGGTANGGVNTLTETLAITVNAVNDAPVRTAGAPAAINVNEDATNLTAITLGMSALTYGPGGGSDESGQTLTYTVTVIPAYMTLWKADGVTQVTASTVVTLAELQGLKYKTIANANGAGNLTWTVVDNGGTANGGGNTLTETLAITVNAVNDAPVRTAGTPAAINVNEDSANVTAITLGMSALTYGPGGGSDESGQTLTYTVTVIPAHITLWKADGVTQVTASTVVTLAELQGLRYKTVANANGSSNLTWTVVDNGGTANGGVNTLTETLAITVNAVNDAPVRTAGAPTAINVNEDSTNVTAITLGMSALTYGPGGGSDESGQTLTYTVTVIPAYMTLWKADGVTQVTASTVVTLTELQGLKYKTVADANGTGNLTWTVVESGSTANGGVNTLTETLAITVNAVNDAPVRTAGTPTAISVNEDSANLTAIALGMSALTYGPGGGSDESGQTLTYTVTMIPAHITLWKADGITQVTASTVVTLTELQGLKYKTVADANGSSNLTWIVVDNGGTANGGVNTLTETLSISVNAVNDAPVRTAGTPAAINVNEDSANVTAITLGMSALTYGPGGGSDESGQTLTYTVTVIPAHITLWKADGITQVTASTLVTLAELQGLKYKTVADANGSSNLTWTVVDNGGTANGGVNTLTETLAITVNAVNDAPVRTAGAPAAINVNEDNANVTAVTLGMSALTYGPGGGSDESGQTLTYTITVIPAHITLWKADGVTQVTASTVVTLAELQGLKYKTVANANGSSNLTWTVADNGGTANGGLNTLTENLAITVNAVNDAPVATITPATYAATEQVALTLKNTGLSISDVDAGGGSMTVTLSVTEGTLNVTAGGSGAVVSSSGTSSVTITGTVTQINNLLSTDGTSTVSYIDNTDTPSASATLTLLVNDNGNTGSGGSLTNSDTAIINITAVNDAPTGSVTIDNTTPAQGDTLTASNTLADADGLGTITYTWKADGTTVGTGATYVVTEAEVGKVMTVEASYTDGYGTNEMVASSPTAAVTNVNDAPTGTVTIDNTTPAQDDTLTASNTLADADGLGPITYTWKANGSTVGTGGTYLVTESEVNKVITVEASYTDGHGTNEMVTSSATAAVTNVNDAPTGSVTIDNTTPAQGDTLTASNTLADADGLGPITYTWKADGSTVGTGATYLVTEAEVNKVITVEASYTDGHGTNEMVASSATAAVTNVNDAPTGSVTIDNTTPAQGDTLTASNTLADADGLGPITYTWKANGTTVGTGATYLVTESEVGKVITVDASYTDGHGTNEIVASSATAAVTNVNDAPTGIVTIDNTTPAQGDTLTASNTLADADGLGPITYTWKADGTTVGTGSTYLVTEAEVNKVITVEASYTDGHGTNEMVASSATAAVTNVNDAPTGTVTIDNTPPAQGDTLTASNTLADADGLGPITYTWKANGTTVGTGATYLVTEAEVNKVITVEASYTDGHGTNEMVASSATAAVTNVNDAPTGTVTIDNTTPAQGDTLTASNTLADADGLGSITYTWKANGSTVGTGSTNLVTEAEVNKVITVEASYTDGHGTNELVASSATAAVTNVNDAPTGSVTIDNTTPAQGNTLTASNTLADPDGLGSITYTWKANGTTVGTGATYLVTEAEVNKVITVEASYTDGHGTNEMVASSATAAVTNVNDAPVGVPLITGTVAEDQTLSIDTSGISDPDGLGAFSYQWLRNGLVVSGATSSTYLLGDADVGTQISVEVRYTDGHGTAEGPLTSAQTAAVVNVNDAPVLGNNAITLLEGGTVVLSSTQLSATDIDNPASGLTFTVSAVAAGHFALATAPQMAITSFTQAQISASQVLFVHDGSETAPGYSVSVSDGNLATTPAAASVAFTNVNDAPVISGLGGDVVSVFNDGVPAKIDVNAPATLNDSDLPSDYNGAVLQITGTGFVVGDSLSLDTTGAVTLSAGFANGSVVSVSGIAVGTLSGVTAGSATLTFNTNSTAAAVNQILRSVTFETTSATLGSRSMAFSFNDSDGTANGGVEQGLTQTVTILVAQAGNGLVTTNEDTIYTFVATDFDFTGATGSNLLYIKVLTLPTSGTLTLNGAAISAGQIVTKSDIDGGLFRFVPVADGNGINYASFDFRVNNGNPTVSVLAGEPNSYTLNAGQLAPTDAILASAANFGNGGVFQSSISVVGTSSTIDAAYLSQGQILFNGYVPDGRWTGTELSALDTWIQNGGILINTSDASTYDDVSSFYGLTIGGNASTTWHVADASSPIMNGPFGLVGTNGSSFSAAGAISYFSSASLAVGDQVLAVDSASGQPTIVLRQHGSGWILFTSDEGIFRANMTGGGTIATANDRLAANVFAWAAGLAPTTSSFTMSINVTPVNDAPVVTSNSLTISEGGTVVLSNADLATTDIDNTAAQLTYTISGLSGGRFEFVSSPGVAITNFTQAQINAGAVRFVHDGNEAAPTYSVTVSDGSLSVGPNAASITFTNINDAPVIADATFSLPENSVTGTSVGTVILTDPDAGDSHVFSITAGNAANGFAINAATGQITVNDSSVLDFETTPVFVLTVQVQDLAGAFDRATITINLTNIDEYDTTPIVDTNATANAVAENSPNGTVVGITAFADDLDQPDTITYSLDDNASGRFAIDAVTGVVTVANGSLLNYENASSHSIIVRATSTDTSFSLRAFTINVIDLDEFDVTPIVDNNAAANAVTENAANGSLVGYTASAFDADATTNVVTYSLIDSAGGRFAINSTTGVVTVANGLLLDREAAAAHTIIVRADSSDGSFSTLSVDINLIDVNEFAISSAVDINAAANVVAELSLQGTLTGITVRATDADATTNAITYSLDNSAGGRFQIDTNTGVVSVGATPLDYETASSYSITARASSADGSTSTITLIVNLTDVNEYAVTAIVDNNAAANTVLENAANGTLVGITAHATDADGTDFVTYSLTRNVGGRFAIDSVTGVVTVANGSLLDREAAVSHDIIARAISTDGSFSTRTWTISLIDVNEFPASPVTDSNAAINTVAENAANGTTVGITASSFDADATTNTMTYTLDDDAGGRFAVHSATGVVTVADSTLLDYETASTHVITIRATSEDGSTTTQNFTINVTDRNDNAPVIIAGQTFSVSELAAVGTVVGDAIATDADTVGTLQNWTITGGNTDGVFAINPTTGRITVTDVTRLNFETTPVYTLTLTVSDGVATSATQTLLINVIDQNEAPTLFVPPTLTVNENAANGTLVGSVTASDPDAGDSLTYTIVSSGPVSPFAIDAVTGQIRVVDSSVLNFEAVTSVTLQIRVTDAAGLTDIQTVTIQIADVNETPTDITLAGNSVNENSAGGTLVGTFSGTDPDAGDTLTFALINSAGGRFTVDATTGILRVAAGAVLNFEVSPTQVLTVRTVDSVGNYYDESFTITINDINDAPVAIADHYTTPQLTTLSVTAANGLLVNDADEDGNGLSVILVSGPGNGTLTLAANGSLVYTPQNNFTGTDTFTYQVTDGLLNSAVITVTVDVFQTTFTGSGSGSGGSGSTGSGSSGGTSSNGPDNGSGGSSGGDSNEQNIENAIPSDVRSLHRNSADGYVLFDDSSGPGSDSDASLASLADSQLNQLASILFSAPGAENQTSVTSAHRSAGNTQNAARFMTDLFGRTVLKAPIDAIVSSLFFTFDQSPHAERMSESTSSGITSEKVVVGSTAVVTTSLSVGYVIWILRGGSLLTAFVSALPAWSSFDPLPVLKSFEKQNEDEDETFLSMVTRKATKVMQDVVK